MNKASTLLALGLTLSACATIHPGGAVEPPARDWRQIATPDDRDRLRDWRDAFAAALKAARASGHAAEIAGEGALLEPDAALAGGSILNGDYHCRVIKLGAKSPGMLDYIGYPAFTCRIGPGPGLQSFAKLTGSQRQVGQIYPADVLRQVFLGTVVLG
ncbi:MAG: DUF4893 domain-containing protein, partial [Sphingomicrobium sp.]